MLDVRMLFSALVDADFLETEAHFRRVDGAKVYRPESLSLQPSEALTVVEERLADLTKKNTAADDVMSVRRDLLDACLKAGSLSRGLFTLSAPTGAGKTLTMLAFALRHACEHDLRRVVVVIPFLSIIEQTARIYREILEPVFGLRYLLEHHSLAGTRKAPGDEKPADPKGEEASDLPVLGEAAAEEGHIETDSANVPRATEAEAGVEAAAHHLARRSRLSWRSLSQRRSLTRILKSCESRSFF